MIDRGQGPLDHPGEIGMEAHPFGPVVKERLPKVRADTTRNTQFLEQLADQALLPGFTRFDLAAGNFPVSSKLKTGSSPRRENLPLVDNDRRRHFYETDIHGKTEKRRRARQAMMATHGAEGSRPNRDYSEGRKP